MSTTRESSHMTRKTMTHTGLENNLDALLEDLQTTVSPKTNSLSRSTVRTSSPQMEFRSAANSMKILSEDRAVSPTRTEHRTLEKFVTTVPAGKPSGIPGLEDLDKELQDVQPGQSKTVAYREVTYHYNKDLNGQPMDSSWKLEDLDKIAQTKNSPAALLDDYHDSTFEETRSRRSPDFGRKAHKEVHYSDSMTRTGSRQASPLPGSRHKEVYHQETSYRSDPKERVIPTSLLNSSTFQDLTTNRELITPPPVPANLAPGPNTKVTTTVKTYTYELPGSPENYMSSSHSRSGDKTVTYTIPGDTSEKTVTYQVEKINEKRAGSPVRFVTSTPEVSSKSVHKEAKYYREERGFRTESPVVTHYVATPSYEHKSTLTRNERFADIGYGPKGPGDFTDHAEKTVIYQNQMPTVNETRTTTIDRMEERFSNRQPPVTNYYCTAPPNTTTTTVYEKYENTYKSPESEVHIVKPYPAGGVKVYPSKPEGPPKKFEDLMASFSDTEREVLQDIEKREKTVTKTSVTKKEVDFVDGVDKKVVASPVYYPPGYEITRKEETTRREEGGSGWAKSKAKYEYESKAKEKGKKRSGKAVVPVCLPLCCALPCTIM